MGGYYIIRLDSENKEGGGVSCYIHDSLRAFTLAISPSSFSNSPKFLILDVRGGNFQPLLFNSMYRRSKGANSNKYVNTLPKYSPNYKNIIITGDLNCNLLTTLYEPNHLRDFTSNLSLNIVPSEPTYHTSYSDSWLDICIVDSMRKVFSFKKSVAPFINDHDLLELTHSFHLLSATNRKIVRRSFKKFVETSYFNTLSANLILSNINDRHSLDGECTDVDLFLHTFTENLPVSLDAHARVHAFYVTHPPASWHSDALSLKIKEKKLYQAARKSKVLLDLPIYISYGDELTIEIRQHKENYHLNKLSDISDPSRMWRELAN